MTRRAAKLQSDTRRPRPCYPPLTSIRGGWEWGGRGAGGGGRGHLAEEIEVWV